MIGIVVSRADEASVHIGDRLRELAEWTERVDDRPDEDGGGVYHTRPGFELREFEPLHLELATAEDAFDDPSMLVFVSRHSGDTGALLTAHYPGNFGPAEFGGEDRELSRACPNALAVVLESFGANAPPGYDVGMECTHHGPSAVSVPCMFAEVGSSPEEWRDPDAARAVARAVLDLDGVAADRDRTVVGFGGGHYAPRFSRIVRQTDWAVGHVAAEWAIGDVTDDVIRQAFERSNTERAVIDGTHPDLADRIAGLGYTVVSETWVRETTGVPLEIVADLEATVRPVDEGLRFGLAIEPEYELHEPDRALLDVLHAIDPAAVREAIAAHAVAYETTENGNRVVGRLAIPTGGYDPLIDRFVELLGDRYDTVERDGDELRATEQAFDPDAARELGVPEGPAFGRLADGDPVEIDGETVRPEAVHTRRQDRFIV